MMLLAAFVCVMVTKICIIDVAADSPIVNKFCKDDIAFSCMLLQYLYIPNAPAGSSQLAQPFTLLTDEKFSQSVNLAGMSSHAFSMLIIFLGAVMLNCAI